MKRINLKDLRLAIQGMKRYSRIYRVLKEELSALGYWQNRPRGNPRKGFQMKGSKTDG